MPKKAKELKPVEIAVPQPVEGIDRWIILGLDPSLSRTGYAVMLVEKAEDRSKANWLAVGSFAPEDTSVPSWIRSKSVALAARNMLQDTLATNFDVSRDPANPMQYAEAAREWFKRTGLIISMEAPTPQNDHLTTISIVLRLIMFEKQGGQDILIDSFGKVHVEFTNASTLRRLMGLTKTGASNKKENVERAFTFLDKGSYPNLDTDACDGVLMAMMARYAAAIFLGFPNTIPERFLIALCDATQEVVGKGKNQKTRTKGILYRPEYWTTYQRNNYAVKLTDARVKKARLDRLNYKRLSKIIPSLGLKTVPSVQPAAAKPGAQIDNADDL